MKTPFIVACMISITMLSSNLYAQFGDMGRDIRMQGRAQEDYKNRKANGEDVRIYEGLENGFSIPLWNLTYEHSFDVNDNNGSFQSRETIQRKAAAKGFIINVSPSWILAKMTPKVNLAFTMNITGGYIKYDIGKVDVNNRSYDQPIMGMLLGIPLSLDLKAGGEATFDKDDAVSFTGGVGIAPVMYLNGFLSVANAKTATRPFMHAELGFFLGAEWKIKASMIGGGMDVLNMSDDGNLDNHFKNNSVIKAKTSPMITFGIAVLPFSIGWDRGGW